MKLAYVCGRWAINLSFPTEDLCALWLEEVNVIKDRIADINDDGSGIKILAEVPLANMFGYSTELRSLTQGKGEFSMEYQKHIQVPKQTQDELMKKYREEKEQDDAA